MTTPTTLPLWLLTDPTGAVIGVGRSREMRLGDTTYDDGAYRALDDAFGVRGYFATGSYDTLLSAIDANDSAARYEAGGYVLQRVTVEVTL